MKKQLFRLMVSAVILTTNPLFAMDAPLEKEESHFALGMLVIQESQEKYAADNQSFFRVISVDGTKEKIFLSNLGNIEPVINVYLIHSKDGEQIHVQNPHETRGFTSNMVVTNKNKITKASYNLSSVNKLTVNPDGTFYAHNTPLVNYVNLYENLPPQPCNPAMSRKDWKGRSYAYEQGKNGSNIVVYENQKELRRHEVVSKFGSYFNNQDNKLYCYQFPYLHKINRDGNIIHTLTLPAAYSRSTRPSMDTPGMLHFWQQTGIIILNKEEKFTEFTPKDIGLTQISGAVATSSPDSVVYCCGPLYCSDPLAPNKAGIAKINLDGIVKPLHDYGLQTIKSIKAGPKDSLYILGTKEDRDAVFVVKKDIMTNSYYARPGHRLQGITSLEGYSSMPMVLKEFSASLYTENGLNTQNFTVLCERLKTIVPTCWEGQDFYDFFAPIVAQSQQDSSVREKLHELFQYYKETPIRAHSIALEFELFGGIDKVYKVNRVFTKDKILEDAVANLANPEQVVERVIRTHTAQKQLEEIVHPHSSVLEPLKGAYNEYLEWVTKAIEILKNLES